MGGFYFNYFRNITDTQQICFDKHKTAVIMSELY